MRRPKPLPGSSSHKRGSLRPGPRPVNYGVAGNPEATDDLSHGGHPAVLAAWDTSARIAATRTGWIIMSSRQAAPDNAGPSRRSLLKAGLRRAAAPGQAVDRLRSWRAGLLGVRARCHPATRLDLAAAVMTALTWLVSFRFPGPGPGRCLASHAQDPRERQRRAGWLGSRPASAAMPTPCG